MNSINSTTNYANEFLSAFQNNLSEKLDDFYVRLQNLVVAATTEHNIDDISKLKEFAEFFLENNERFLYYTQQSPKLLYTIYGMYQGTISTALRILEEQENNSLAKELFKKNFNSLLVMETIYKRNTVTINHVYESFREVFSKDKVRRLINSLISIGYVSCHKIGRVNYYSLTVKGSNFAEKNFK